MKHDVRSPLPGIFYSKPSPDEPPFVEVGSTVSPDSVVALVEVMKTFHNLTADVAGTVATIEIGDGDMVDAGQVLLTIESESPSSETAA